LPTEDSNPSLAHVLSASLAQQIPKAFLQSRMASIGGRESAPCSKYGLVVRGSSGYLGYVGLKPSQENREWAIHILGL